MSHRSYTSANELTIVGGGVVGGSVGGFVGAFVCMTRGDEKAVVRSRSKENKRVVLSRERTKLTVGGFVGTYYSNRKATWRDSIATFKVTNKS